MKKYLRCLLICLATSLIAGANATYQYPEYHLIRLEGPEITSTAKAIVKYREDETGTYYAVCGQADGHTRIWTLRVNPAGVEPRVEYQVLFTGPEGELKDISCLAGDESGIFWSVGWINVGNGMEIRKKGYYYHSASGARCFDPPIPNNEGGYEMESCNEHGHATGWVFDRAEEKVKAFVVDLRFCYNFLTSFSPYEYGEDLPHESYAYRWNKSDDPAGITLVGYAHDSRFARGYYLGWRACYWSGFEAPACALDGAMETDFSVAHDVNTDTIFGSVIAGQIQTSGPNDRFPSCWINNVQNNIGTSDIGGALAVNRNAYIVGWVRGAPNKAWITTLDRRQETFGQVLPPTNLRGLMVNDQLRELITANGITSDDVIVGGSLPDYGFGSEEAFVAIPMEIYRG